MSGNGSDDQTIMTSAEAAENAILSQKGCVQATDNAPQAAESKPIPAEITDKPVEQKSPAEWAYERIILYIQNFEEQLESEEEVVMGHVGGDAGSLRIQGMGFFAPDLVTFYGVDAAGLKTQMVQHVSQLTVMLRAVPKPKEQPEAVRIGFRLGESLKTSKAQKT